MDLILFPALEIQGLKTGECPVVIGIDLYPNDVAILGNFHLLEVLSVWNVRFVRVFCYSPRRRRSHWRRGHLLSRRHARWASRL